MDQMDQYDKIYLYSIAVGFISILLFIWSLVYFRHIENMYEIEMKCNTHFIQKEKQMK